VITIAPKQSVSSHGTTINTAAMTVGSTALWKTN